MAVRNTGFRCRKCRRRKADENCDAARGGAFRHDDWSGLTGFLLAKETRPWYVYVLLALVNCIISILVYAGADALAAWLGG